MVHLRVKLEGLVRKFAKQLRWDGNIKGFLIFKNQFLSIYLSEEFVKIIELSFPDIKGVIGLESEQFDEIKLWNQLLNLRLLVSQNELTKSIELALSFREGFYLQHTFNQRYQITLFRKLRIATLLKRWKTLKEGGPQFLLITSCPLNFDGLMRMIVSADITVQRFSCTILAAIINCSITRAADL